MTKLKTLKELIKNFPDETVPGFTIVNPDDLRNAGEKWRDSILKNFKAFHGKKLYNVLLKSLDATDITFDEICSGKAYLIENPHVIYALSKLRWIKQFFNLE